MVVLGVVLGIPVVVVVLGVGCAPTTVQLIHTVTQDQAQEVDATEIITMKKEIRGTGQCQLTRS